MKRQNILWSVIKRHTTPYDNLWQVLSRPLPPVPFWIFTGSQGWNMNLQSKRTNRERMVREWRRCFVLIVSRGCPWHLFGEVSVEKRAPHYIPTMLLVGIPERARGQKRKGQKLLTSSRKKKMFAEDISEDFSEDRRYQFYWILEYFRISSKSSRKIAFFWKVFGSFLPSGFLPLSRFQELSVICLLMSLNCLLFVCYVSVNYRWIVCFFLLIICEFSVNGSYFPRTGPFMGCESRKRGSHWAPSDMLGPEGVAMAPVPQEAGSSWRIAMWPPFAQLDWAAQRDNGTERSAASRAHVGNRKCGSGPMWDLGSTGRKRKGPCTKQCAWRKHGSWRKHALLSSETLKNTESRRDAFKMAILEASCAKMRLVEAQCAHRKHCYAETPLGRHPT